MEGQNRLLKFNVKLIENNFRFIQFQVIQLRKSIYLCQHYM